MVATTRYISWVAVATTVGFLGCASPTTLPPGGVGGGGPADNGGNRGEPTLEYDDLAQPNPATNTDLSAAADLGAADLTSPSVVDLSTPPPPPDLLAPPNDLTAPPTTLKVADLCASAPYLPAGVTYSNQDSTPLLDDYDFSVSASTACSVFSPFAYPGGDGAYRFSIPAGKTLKVVVTTVGGWDAALAILTDCARPGPTCLSGSDGLTSTETVSYKNPGSAPLEVYVVLDAYSFLEYGKYSIRADVL
jgi:hypothetical protein